MVSHALRCHPRRRRSVAGVSPSFLAFVCAAAHTAEGMGASCSRGGGESGATEADGVLSAARRRQLSCKIVFLGESAVGKSSIALRFVKEQFFKEQPPTLGAAFLSKEIELQTSEGPQKIRLDIWDTAGQEKYYALAPMYYRGASAAIIVFDISVPNSFEKAKTWVGELRRQGPQDIAIALVGNKIDLGIDARPPAAEAYAEEENLELFYTSALTGENVDALFQRIGAMLAERAPRPSAGGIVKSAP